MNSSTSAGPGRRGLAVRLDVDAIQKPVGPQRGDGLGGGLSAGGDDHPGRAGQRQLVDQRGRQDVQVVRVVDDQQQLLRIAPQRLPGPRAAARPASRGRLMSIRWLNAPNGTTRSVGVPVTQRMSRLGWPLAKCSAARRASVDLPTPSGPRTTAPAAPRRQRPQVRHQGNVQLLEGGRVLRDVPSNRHRRILRCAAQRRIAFGACGNRRGGRSVCTAPRGRRTPNCWRWPPNSARRSPNGAGRWCRAGARSRRWVPWRPRRAPAAATPSA